MCAVYNPKTLAKTLSTILYLSPGEHGLFWDGDGSMPWKEVYWVFQGDPSLRFVRESHLKEIAYLGIEFPVYLDGKLCRLKDGIVPPQYTVAEDLPRRLYFGCPRRRLSRIRDDGLHPTTRSLVPLLADRNMAVAMGQRRDPDAIVIEVLCEKAAQEGVRFLIAGGPLYLVPAVPPSCLVLPLIRAEDTTKSAERKKEKPSRKPSDAVSAAPGSFFVTETHFHQTAPGLPGREAGGKPQRKGKRGADWKRDSRKERGKREV